MLRYRPRVAPRDGAPGGFGFRIILLLAALFLVVSMRQSCSSGVADVFRQLAPVPTSQPRVKIGVPLSFPSSEPTSGPSIER